MSSPANSSTVDDFLLDRCQAVPALVGKHQDFLIVTGLAGAARDIAALTDDGVHIYAMAGAMGAAAMMGFGLALAQAERRVLVVTGDGELLMNIGALATIAVADRPNLSIICVDNGHYGETGYQKSHTSLGVDLEKMAIGAGFKITRTVTREDELLSASRLIREANGTAFVCLRVKASNPPSYRRLLDPAACRNRFRSALLGRP